MSTTGIRYARVRVVAALALAGDWPGVVLAVAFVASGVWVLAVALEVAGRFAAAPLGWP